MTNTRERTIFAIVKAIHIDEIAVDNSGKMPVTHVRQDAIIQGRTSGR